MTNHTPQTEDQYIGFRVMAKYKGQDRDALIEAIQRVFGCVDLEPDEECPMLICASTVGTEAQVAHWLDLK